VTSHPEVRRREKERFFMSRPPETIRTWFTNRLWRLWMGPVPNALSLYRGHVEAEDREEFTQDIARLIFANEGDLVHKWMHYLPIYEEIFGRFRGTDVRFLEIGVSFGGSQKIWREYFGETATIFGIDINPDCAKYDGRYSQVRIGSQDDPGFLRSVVEEMGGVDVILDDGSHLGRHQQASYRVLFPLLSEDGLYAIEDLHTAYWPNWEGGVSRSGTGIAMLKDEIDRMHRHYVRRGLNNSASIAPIQSIQFFDSVAVVHKRGQAPRRHFMVPEPA
jgi:hypothetical protein